LNSNVCSCAFDFDIGLFTPNDDLAKELIESCEKAGEKIWRLPMEESYWEAMKSSIADMVNSGGRPGGSILASLFLKQVCFESKESLFINLNISYTIKTSLAVGAVPW
jgi:leucyl aminopeptidase